MFDDAVASFVKWCASLVRKCVIISEGFAFLFPFTLVALVEKVQEYILACFFHE